MKLWLCALLSLCITAIGLFVLAAGTHGYSVWTQEGQRRWQVAHHPQQLPQFNWRNQSHEVRSVAKLNKPIVLLDFIYTSCPTVCQLMGYEFGRLQRMLQEKRLEHSVQLLSISFDTERDTPATIGEYLKRFHANTAHWEGGIIEEKIQLMDLLGQLGVIVLPDGQGGFVHNAAFYLVYEGTLIGIFDSDQLHLLLESIADLSPVI